MGSSQSTNEIDEGVQMMTDIINSVVQSNTTTVTVNQDIIVNQSGCENQNVTISNVTMKQVQTIDVEASQEAVQSADVTTELEQAAQQMAESMSSSLSLSQSDSDNITSLWTEMATTIQNISSQIIEIAVQQSQQILVNQLGGENCSTQNATIQYIDL